MATCRLQPKLMNPYSTAAIIYGCIYNATKEIEKRYRSEINATIFARLKIDEETEGQ